MTDWLPPHPPDPFDEVLHRERADKLRGAAQGFNDLYVLLLLGSVLGLLLGASHLFVSVAVVNAIVFRCLAVVLSRRASR